MSELVARPTFRNLSTHRDDIANCSNVPARAEKLRFDLPHGPDGERVRAYQGNSLVVTPPLANALAREQHYLLHATSLRAAASILRGGFLTPPSGRKEIHFAECSYTARQAQYLNTPAGSRGVWILIDARIAMSDGREFRLLPNGAVVATGNAGRIPQRCIVSAWKDDVTMMVTNDILKETPELATQAQPSNGVYHAPFQRDRFCADTTLVNIPQSSEGSASPDQRKRDRPGSPVDFQPRPQPSRVGCAGV